MTMVLVANRLLYVIEPTSTSNEPWVLVNCLKFEAFKRTEIVIVYANYDRYNDVAMMSSHHPTSTTCYYYKKRLCEDINGLIIQNLNFGDLIFTLSIRQ